jgi:AcrR family transcriptional regulator
MKKTVTKTRQIPTSIKNESLVKKRRQQIYDAAMKLFPQKGYSATTLREISKESGIALGNIYDYIRTKQDILYIIQEKATEMIENFILIQDDSFKPKERLIKLINCEIDMVYKYQNEILLIYQESHAWSKDLLHNSLANERRRIEHYEKVVAQGIKEGIFKSFNPRIIANMIVMVVNTWVLRRWDLRNKVNIEELRRCILDVVLNGIISEQAADGCDNPKMTHLEGK